MAKKGGIANSYGSYNLTLYNYVAGQVSYYQVINITSHGCVESWTKI